MSAPNYYNVNFGQLAAAILRPFYRTQFNLRWFIALLSPLQTLHAYFLSFRESRLYKIEHTGQVWSLENVLNDAFDTDARRIYITDGVLVQPLYVYRRIEERPLYVRKRAENTPLYLRRRSENEDNDKDFIVHIPIELQPQDEADLASFTAQVVALVDFYKIASKTYRIVYYE